jgi:hypothetical protein
MTGVKGDPGDPGADGGTLDLAGNSGSATNISSMTFEGAGGASVDVTDEGGGAATVTVTAAGGGSGQGLVDFATAKRTSGSLSLNNTSWTNVDTGLDLTLDVTLG